MEVLWKEKKDLRKRFEGRVVASTPEVPSSNPVINEFLYWTYVNLLSTVAKKEKERKRGREWSNFFKKENDAIKSGRIRLKVKEGWKRERDCSLIYEILVRFKKAGKLVVQIHEILLQNWTTSFCNFGSNEKLHKSYVLKLKKHWKNNPLWAPSRPYLGTWQAGSFEVVVCLTTDLAYQVENLNRNKMEF